MLVARRLGYTSEAVVEGVLQLAAEEGRIINGLRNSLRLDAD